MHTFAEKPKAIRQTASATSSKPGWKLSGQSQSVRNILHSQRPIDNHVQTESGHSANARVGRGFSQLPIPPNHRSPAFQHGGSAASSNIHAVRGLKPGSETNIRLVRGGCSGDEDEYVVLGNVLRLGVGSTVAAVPVSISSTTRKGPTWKNGGEFVWDVGFSTTGRSGWIIQEITNTWFATNLSGKAIRNPSTPHFYEAWAVDGSGNVTPSSGKANDSWDNLQPQVLFGAVKGNWSTIGKLYFTKTNPATQGFVINNPATGVKGLLSSTNAPAGLGAALLYRYANGVWDSTGAAPFHFGVAWPK